LSSKVALKPEMKKPAAGGDAAGFSNGPNSDWEEECRYSLRRPLGGGVEHLQTGAMREEVHRFARKDHSDRLNSQPDAAPQNCHAINA